MSGTESRKTGPGRREARAIQEQQEKRKLRRTAIIIVIVVVLLFLGALFVNSKLIRRVVTAVTVGGIKFTAAEFDYFYQNTVYEYSGMMNEQLGDYAAELLPSNDRPHSSQIKDEETGETWSAFFGRLAIEKIAEMVSYHNDAINNGYTMTEETRNSIDEEIENLKLTADMYSAQFKDFDAFLQEFYGASMNEKSFRKIAEFVDTVEAYKVFMRDSFNYSHDDLVGYYAENKDSLDTFSYRYFTVYIDTIDETDFDSTDEYEAAKEAALADAFGRAQEIVAGIGSEEDFIEAARGYDPELYEKDDSTLHDYQGEWLGSIYGPWLREAGRVGGDVSAFEMSNGAYVVYFVSRDNNEYKMVEMRQLLFMRDEVEENDFFVTEDLDPGDYYFDEDAYDQAVSEADGIARSRADEALELFRGGGSTEAKLIELMEEHSDDYTEGGFYSEITTNAAQNKMVREIEEWLFDPVRKVGDYELIRTEDYGYHLVYFMGWGERYCDFVADERMRDRDYGAWMENLSEPTSSEHWGMILTQRRRGS